MDVRGDDESVFVYDELLAAPNNVTHIRVDPSVTIIPERQQLYPYMPYYLTLKGLGSDLSGGSPRPPYWPSHSTFIILFMVFVVHVGWLF